MTRKSPFAGMSPVAPARDAHADTPRTAESPQSPTSPRRTEATQRWTLRLPVTLVETARTAWMVDGAPRGVRNVSAWVGEILAAEIDRIEAKHGPLSGTPAGMVPSGWDARQ